MSRFGLAAACSTAAAVCRDGPELLVYLQPTDGRRTGRSFDTGPALST